jgi:hypothetical protein
VYEDHERLQRLGEQHVPGLDETTRRILVARAAGRSFEEAAADSHYAERTARDRVERALWAAFHPLGLHVSGWAAGYWVARHLQCCLGVQEVPQELRQKL